MKARTRRKAPAAGGEGGAGRAGGERRQSAIWDELYSFCVGHINFRAKMRYFYADGARYRACRTHNVDCNGSGNMRANYLKRLNAGRPSMQDIPLWVQKCVIIDGRAIFQRPH